jgi:TetR/AcrR family transcriptional repressor of lmrAB and yxaGH operons
MATRLVSDSDLLGRLDLMFRSAGYDGATITDISDASGLKKSSLYHRFPGGKQQMAADVARATTATFVDDVLAPLGGDGPAHDRLRLVARQLRSFYDHGRRSCLLDTLSLGDPGDDARATLRAAAEGWIAAFATIARADGAGRAEARTRAEDAVAAVEGALVLARVTGDVRPFTRVLERLPSLVLRKEQQS